MGSGLNGLRATTITNKQYNDPCTKTAVSVGSHFCKEVPPEIMKTYTSELASQPAVFILPACVNSAAGCRCQFHEVPIFVTVKGYLHAESFSCARGQTALAGLGFREFVIILDFRA